MPSQTWALKLTPKPQKREFFSGLAQNYYVLVNLNQVVYTGTETIDIKLISTDVDGGNDEQYLSEDQPTIYMVGNSLQIIASGEYGQNASITALWQAQPFIPIRNKSAPEPIWDWLKKWQERLKILIWFVTSFVGGLSAALYAVHHYLAAADKYLDNKVDDRIAQIQAYESTPDTEIVGPQSAKNFKVRCRPGDIPLSFTFNADINKADPILRLSSKVENGFDLNIFNGAGVQNPGAPITVAAQCLATGHQVQH